jgi:hypothetical protein
MVGVCPKETEINFLMYNLNYEKFKKHFFIPADANLSIAMLFLTFAALKLGFTNILAT